MKYRVSQKLGIKKCRQENEIPKKKYFLNNTHMTSLNRGLRFMEVIFMQLFSEFKVLGINSLIEVLLYICIYVVYNYFNFKSQSNEIIKV